MFMITPSSQEDFKNATAILNQYPDIMYRATVEGNDITITVDSKDNQAESQRLVEMAFQLNWHQGYAFACPACSKFGETVCGHLVFTKPIKAAF